MLTSLVEGAAGPIPRRFLTVGLPAAYLLLTGMFVCAGFPTDRAGATLAARLEAATGAPVRIGALGIDVGLLGPGVEARDVEVRPAGLAPIEFERLLLRPAWSTGWLKGEPSLYLELDSAYGAASGVFSLGETRAFAGELRDVDLGSESFARAIEPAALQGSLDAEVEFELSNDGPRGRVNFRVAGGSVSVPGSPIAIPFETLAGELVIGAGGTLEVKSLDLAGPMFDASIEGRVTPGRAGDLRRAALQLNLRLAAKDLVSRTALRGLGLRLDRDGVGSLQIGGTLQNPQLQ